MDSKNKIIMAIYYAGASSSDAYKISCFANFTAEA
jgi:hypothetical protein